jgi:hypothetical protein
MTTRIEMYTVPLIAAILFGASVLISTSITTIPVSAQVDQETANKQLDQAIKALESGDTEGAKTHIEAAQGSL